MRPPRAFIVANEEVGSLGVEFAKSALEITLAAAGFCRTAARRSACNLYGAAMAGRSQEEERLATLMRSAQNGDAGAYAQLLNGIVPLLRKEMRRRRLQPADREDLVQDILLSLHSARATYDRARPFLPWLMAIAHNRMVDGARKHARRSSCEATVDNLDQTFSSQATNPPAEAYGDPDALRQAIGDLPRRQRDAVRMVKLREMSLKEAAAASGTSIGALKVAVHRGMASLRRALGPRS